MLSCLPWVSCNTNAPQVPLFSLTAKSVRYLIYHLPQVSWGSITALNCCIISEVSVDWQQHPKGLYWVNNLSVYFVGNAM